MKRPPAPHSHPSSTSRPARAPAATCGDPLAPAKHLPPSDSAAAEDQIRRLAKAVGRLSDRLDAAERALEELEGVPGRVADIEGLLAERED